MNESEKTSPEIQKAYGDYTLLTSVRNAQVALVLVIVLMPIGYVLDRFVYPEFTPYFFKLRLCTSLCGALALVALRRKGLPPLYYHIMSNSWWAIPSVFINMMIATSGGLNSTYYAGLNLVMLAVSSVIQATMLQSVVAIAVISTMYAISCFSGGSELSSRMLFNNGYFMFCTAAIVITGNFFFNRLRLREFVLRWELDENRRQIEAANQQLKELDQIKGRFFANISHELRTPLTLMISPLETIIARHSAALGPDTANLLRTMQGNGLRLLKLINDLLDLVRLDSGVLQAKREPVAVAEFLTGMASAARQIADDKKIQMVVTTSPSVGVAMLDRDKMEKVVLNLQFNALKFTPSGGKVELRADKEGEEFVLRVSDTGIGIPAKDLPKMFGRFFQVDSSSRRKYQGVGIGLALVKEFVELHGGSVKVDSVEGKGTTFTARMPFIAPEPGAETVAEPTVVGVPSLQSVDAPPSEVAPAADTVAAPDIARGAASEAAVPAGEPTVSSQEWLSNLYHRANLFGTPMHDKSTASTAGAIVQPVSSGHDATVLVADDQPDMLGFIKSVLASRYNVIPVSDGQQAVDNAAAHLPDIILLDMMMPEKDGIQACREIRAAEATRNTPIVLITAHVDEETKLNALRAGASDFLPKPFSTTELQVRVQNLIVLNKSQRELSEKNQTLATTIEQLKETETQLVQTEKIAALGRLSAGIIHEINNPLNFATTGLYTLRSKAKLIPDSDRDGYAEILKDVEEGIHRVKSIVSDLRTFTHPGSRGFEEVNVQEVVASALRLLSQEWKNKVELRVDVSDGHVVWADKNKLIQVLINLLQNSLDALRGKQFENGKPEIVISGRVERESSLISVRDNGEGIAPEVMDKIFDPFFTTKDVGEGMGLGLSICYRIVKDFGGRISVRSESGSYCEFTLEFPVGHPQTDLQP